VKPLPKAIAIISPTGCNYWKHLVPMGLKPTMEEVLHLTVIVKCTNNLNRMIITLFKE
jgi:hypothetical protein